MSRRKLLQTKLFKLEIVVVSFLLTWSIQQQASRPPARNDGGDSEHVDWVVDQRRTICSKFIFNYTFYDSMKWTPATLAGR